MAVTVPGEILFVNLQSKIKSGGALMHSKDMARSMAEKSAKGFWKSRSTTLLKGWVWFHLAIFLGLEFLGLVPGVSHSIDFMTLVIGDELIQLILVTPAVKELWRREFQEETEEQANEETSS